MDKNDIPHMSNMKPISNVVDVVFDVLRSTSMKIDWKDARTNLILFLYHKANLERNPNFQQQIDSFDKLSIVDFSIVGKTLVAVDIRNILNKEDKRRVMDFVTGLSIGRGCSIRQINKEGVYLLNPSESNS